MANKKQAMASFCQWEGDILVLNVLGKPSSKQDVIGKAKGPQLKISVTASPVAEIVNVVVASTVKTYATFLA